LYPTLPNLIHECVPNVLMLSSNVNECKPLGTGGTGGTVDGGGGGSFDASDLFDEDQDAAALGGAGLVRVLPDIRATCELSFHGGSSAELARRCPLVAAVLVLAPKAGGH